MQQNFTTFDLGFIQAKINQNYYWVRPDKKVKHRVTKMSDNDYNNAMEQVKLLKLNK